MIENFNREVDSIEKEAKGFIDKSFKNLRSAEAAFDLLLNFQHIRSREAINRQMMMKFSEILEQYMVEVGPFLNIHPISFYLSEVEVCLKTSFYLYNHLICLKNKFVYSLICKQILVTMELKELNLNVSL